MSKDDFRRELNNVFDDVSGPPSSGLRDRVRSGIASAPEARSPYWIAGVAACVLTALIVGALYVANPLRRPIGPIPGGMPTPTATAQPFVCTQQDYMPTATPSAGAQSTAFVSALRTASQSSYDRLTIEFQGGSPTDVRISGQSGTTFTASPSGQPVTLKGTNGIQIVMRDTDLHTSYSGSTDIITGYNGLAEVRRLEDFEGVVQLGLGVNGPACYRAFFLASPSRLVVDVQAGAALTPSPTSKPSASPQTFVCTNQDIKSASQGTPPPVVYISGLRPGAHGTYDRLVIDLGNGVPGNVTVEVRSGTSFTMSPSGMATTVKGKNGILVTIRGADLHTSYSGSTDIVTGYPGLAEVKRIEDFEGVVQLGLGVNGPACYHAYFLTNPNRLVIDVQAG